MLSRSTPALRRTGMCTTGRPFHCRLCCKAVVICRSCDRNHQYCSPACRSKGRTQNRRKAQRRYNKTENGRLKNAKRQQAYRQRLTDEARKIAQATKSTMAVSMRLVLEGIQRRRHARSKETVTDHSYRPPMHSLLSTTRAQRRVTSRSPCVICNTICSYLVEKDL